MRVREKDRYLGVTPWKISYLRTWRNGIRSRLKICFPTGSAGSSPAVRTSNFNGLHRAMRWLARSDSDEGAGVSLICPQFAADGRQNRHCRGATSRRHGSPPLQQERRSRAAQAMTLAVWRQRQSSGSSKCSCYNLAPSMRTVWSLTSLREKLTKIGAKVVRHGGCGTFQWAEIAVPRQKFADILC
jgi:hypothetical protein